MLFVIGHMSRVCVPYKQCVCHMSSVGLGSRFPGGCAEKLGEHHPAAQVLLLPVDIIVTTRSAPLQTDSLEPAAVLAASQSEKLTLNIFPDLEVKKDVHVTRLILMPHLPNKLGLQEFVVDDLGKSFDNNKV